MSHIHSELWPKNFHRAAKLADRLLPPQAGDEATALLLAGDVGSDGRRNVYRAVVDASAGSARASCQSATGPLRKGPLTFLPRPIKAKEN